MALTAILIGSVVGNKLINLVYFLSALLIHLLPCSPSPSPFNPSLSHSLISPFLPDAELSHVSSFLHFCLSAFLRDNSIKREGQEGHFSGGPQDKKHRAYTSSHIFAFLHSSQLPAHLPQCFETIWLLPRLGLWMEFFTLAIFRQGAE